MAFPWNLDTLVNMESTQGHFSKQVLKFVNPDLGQPDSKLSMRNRRSRRLEGVQRPLHAGWTSWIARSGVPSIELASTRMTKALHFSRDESAQYRSRKDGAVSNSSDAQTVAG
jgi:hypothetical protein